MHSCVAGLWPFQGLARRRLFRLCFRCMDTRSSASSQSAGSLCLTLVGMAGAGKTTVGRLLAKGLGWAHLDTDRLIEAYYGLDLQTVFDCLGLAGFIDAEDKIVAMLGTRRCVISTGGSVIYGTRAIARLKALGPILFLRTSAQVVRQRIGSAEHRGLAISEGQTLEALHAERQPLYERAADMTFDTDVCDAEPLAARILDWLDSQRADGRQETSL